MTIPERMKTFLPWAGAALTGLLLAASFPPLEWGWAAWVALVPLLLGLNGVRVSKAWKLGLAAGVFFWIPSISWLIHVTFWGWIGLALVCSLYLIPFAVVAAWWTRRYGAGEGWRNLLLMLALAGTWAGFEYIRSVFATGFPWNPLGASQYRSLPVIQAARWGGVTAVSALVALVNAAAALTILRHVKRPRPAGRGPHLEMAVALFAVILAVSDGYAVLRRPAPPSQTLRVALVQPNVPQACYYMPEEFDGILAGLRNLSEAALRGRPDLLIWPETAPPDEIRTDGATFDLVYALVTNGAPLLAGTMDTAWGDTGPTYFNSSALVDAGGRIAQVYDKRHLVPFGEYVPLRHIFPFLKVVTPITDSFTPGSTSTVFKLAAAKPPAEPGLEKPQVTLSVLICFEDTVAALARESVRNGARMLVNQTNDAWFDPSGASRQHMIQCVFRCVENGVPAVRCANTGVSCAIDRWGRVYDVLDDGAGQVRVSGFRLSAVEVPDAGLPPTFYTRHGDLFAQACAAAGIALFFLVLGTSRRATLPAP